MNVYAIIVSYNGVDLLEKCINSLLVSNLLVKVFVVDNSSTDGTLDFLRNNFTDIEILAQSKNLGFGQANNIGFRKALEDGADYVFLLNQDAWVEPDTISSLIGYHMKFPGYGILSPVHLNGTGNALDPGFASYVSHEKCPGFVSDAFVGTLKKIYKVDFVNAAAWLLPISTIEVVGGFSTIFFHYGEDYDYASRLKFKGFSLGIVPEAVVYHARNNIASSVTCNSELLRQKRHHQLVWQKVQLSNINYPARSIFYGYFLDLLCDTLKHALRFRFAAMYANFILHFKVSSSIPHIYRARKKAIRSVRPFL